MLIGLLEIYERSSEREGLGIAIAAFRTGLVIYRSLFRFAFLDLDFSGIVIKGDVVD